MTPAAYPALPFVYLMIALSGIPFVNGEFVHASAYEPKNGPSISIRKTRALVADALFNGQNPQTARILIVIAALFVLAAFSYLFVEEYRTSPQHNQRTTPVPQTIGTDAEATDPSLLKKHSTYQSYTVTGTGTTYPMIRTFYRQHPQAEKLPNEPSPLPLLVFIHGLGGSVAQFHPLLTSLVNVAPCLSIDLPGCGLSKFQPTAWSAYTTEALVGLLETVIEAHRARADDHHGDQGVVLIGHSMGCSLAALLASRTSPYPSKLQKHVLGLIAICPRASPPSMDQVKTFKRMLSVPGPLFDLWRLWDRRGGTESASVLRFVGIDAEQETKELQLRFNEQSKTPVWRRVAYGAMPAYSNGRAKGGFPGGETWAGIDSPIFLIGGEADAITPAAEVAKIAQFLGKSGVQVTSRSDFTNGSASKSGAAVHKHSNSDHGPFNHFLNKPEDNSARPEHEFDMTEQIISSNDNRSTGRRLLATAIIPSPASHALLYAPTTCRTLAGLIQSFLADHVDERLSLGWQLQYLTTEGKWDVKNLAKWQAVAPVSEPIDKVFRAMKTLREVDDKHSPTQFVKDWKGKIRAVVDISHESSVYNPEGLETGGIEYYKFPTVSKLPPTVNEVRSFISLVDRLRSKFQLDQQAKTENRTVIGVHCHYGFNRTGFFIVCYMVEREGYTLQAAIDEFARQRPPGIRHEHFIDSLYVRYHVGLKRAPTL